MSARLLTAALLLLSCKADAEPPASPEASAGETSAQVAPVEAAVPLPPAPDAGAPGAAEPVAPDWTPALKQELAAGKIPQWLDLSLYSGTKVAWSELEMIAHGRTLDTVLGLDLSRQPLGMQGGKALGASGHVGQLIELRLAHCELGDNGVRAIAYARGFDSLQRLDLSFNEAGEIATKSLSTAKYLGRLTHLDLRGNAAPTVEAAEQLGRKLLSIEVLRVDASWPEPVLEALRTGLGERAGALTTEAPAP